MATPPFVRCLNDFSISFEQQSHYAVAHLLSHMSAQEPQALKGMAISFSSHKYWEVELGFEGICVSISNCHPRFFQHTFAVRFLLIRRKIYTLQELLDNTTMNMLKR